MNNQNKYTFLVLFLITIMITLVFPVNVLAPSLHTSYCLQSESEYGEVFSQSYKPLSLQQSNYQKYEGTIYHIFFHSLILDTHKAFNSSMKEGYNMWMTTREEFKAMLPLLYQNDFVLIDLTSLIKKDSNGIRKNPLYLPKGKKPLVISVDDVNYYEYMKNDGFATRLALDNKGKVCNIVTKNGKEAFDYEGDVVPILDKFVDTHPDFSPFGAKGILAVTGYEGVFGYRTTTLTGKQKQDATLNATKVANALKATGWKIACHSYTHSRKFYDASISLDDLQKDTLKWKSEIGKIVGQTPIYIPPFGCNFELKGERLRYLKEEGFCIFCPIYKEMTMFYGKDFMISNRLNLDGFTMLKYPQRIKNHFFDPSVLVDSSRHNIKI